MGLRVRWQLSKIVVMQEGFQSPPVIICGAHGGGTSYVTKMLRFAGFHAGDDAGFIRARKYHESVTFKALNYALGERVDDIDILSMESINRIEQELQAHMNDWESRARSAVDPLPVAYGRPSRASWLRGGQALMWWGNRLFPQVRWTWPGWMHSRLRKVPAGNPWGWKDPRNGAVLPLWTRVYPKARILLIRKRLDQREPRSPSGAWFRDASNHRCAECLQAPPAAAGCRDVMDIEFERVTSDSGAFNDLLRWLELPELSPRQFRGLLRVTRFEAS